MGKITAYYRFEVLDNEIRKEHKIRSDIRLDCVGCFDTKERLQAFVNKKGQLFLYKKEARHIVKANAKRLADFALTNSIGGNLTSLYYDDIDYPRFAYGYPNKSIGGQFINDAYLFIINESMTKIEVLIIANGRNLISTYYQALIEGAFDKDLKVMREESEIYFNYWLDSKAL